MNAGWHIVYEPKYHDEHGRPTGWDEHWVAPKQAE